MECNIMAGNSDAIWIVLAMVLDRHFGSGSMSALKRWQIGCPVCQ